MKVTSGGGGFVGASGADLIATINIDEKSGIIEEAACRLRDGGWQTVST